MNFIGNGLDIVEVDRITKAIKKWGEKFYNRILTFQERKIIKLNKNFSQRLAGRFAVKEAIFKAISSVENINCNWQDINVLNNKKGVPQVFFEGNLKKFIEKRNFQFIISLSHTKRYAVATALIFKNNG
jgi:holo-[acyl-carrier protein] synthase